MQGIYKYIPETNHFSMVHSVAAVLYLQFVLHVILFRMWNMLCAFTLAHYYYYRALLKRLLVTYNYVEM
jgi:hypothetical protein